MKILVVDDHPLIMEDIKDELTDMMPDAEVMGTSNSLEVEDLCDEHRFDVIFMDIDMPGINGLELAKRIMDKYPKTNIIYVTGYEKYALDSYKTWASAFLVKPVSTKRLKEAMNNLRFPVSEITEEMVEEQSRGTAAIGSRIKMYRERRGFSRNEFAESGDRVPDVISLMDIARILGIDMNQITGGGES